MIKLLLIEDEEEVALWSVPEGCFVGNAASVGGKHEFDSTGQALNYLKELGYEAEKTGDFTWRLKEPAII